MSHLKLLPTFHTFLLVFVEVFDFWSFTSNAENDDENDDDEEVEPDVEDEGEEINFEQVLTLCVSSISFWKPHHFAESRYLDHKMF